MNVKLKNRKAVQTNLADFVGGMSISDTLVGTICNGQVNDEYIKALEQLDKKLNYVANQVRGRAETVDATACCGCGCGLTVCWGCAVAVL